MNTADLKLDLIKAISETNNLDLLIKLKQLFVQKETNTSVYVFNDSQQNSVNEAMNDYKNGAYISDEEAQIEIEKWFQEQEK